MEITEKEAGKLEVILKAAQKKFAEFGLAKTTMNDIASELGMGKASIYYYFDCKESLYEAVISKEQEHFLQEIQKIIKPSVSAKAILKVYSKKRTVLFEYCLNLAKLNGEGLSNCLPFVKKLFDEFGQKEVELIKSILELGMTNEEFAPIHAGVEAEFICTMMLGLRQATKYKMKESLMTKDDYKILNSNMSKAVDMFISSIEK
ncbi:MAG: TetR/AcrR family transcriptional regulator [Opitutaceae bacterium]|nr:TetR/AcrR family transcriptional regulator [Cytophagales bacterium]